MRNDPDSNAIIKQALVKALQKVVSRSLPKAAPKIGGVGKLKKPKSGSTYTKIAKAKKDMPDFVDQDRPAKVKEIYKALKRDHPEMSAEMKARIAARQGKKGKQKQGPPYKGPISKEGSAQIEILKRNWKQLVKSKEFTPQRLKTSPLRKKLKRLIMEKKAGKGKVCFYRNGKRMCYYPDDKYKPKKEYDSMIRDKLRE